MPLFQLRVKIATYSQTMSFCQRSLNTAVPMINPAITRDFTAVCISCTSILLQSEKGVAKTL
jgi:hypothetical protein